MMSSRALSVAARMDVVRSRAALAVVAILSFVYHESPEKAGGVLVPPPGDESPGYLSAADKSGF